MSVYIYFILGIILGLAIAIVIWADRSEKIEDKIKLEKKLFSTEKLDNVIKISIDRIATRIEERDADITEEEKNEIIAQCCKKEFGI